MIGYIFKRLLLMIPTVAGVLTLFFLISEFVPGGPYDRVIAMIRGNSGVQNEAGGGNMGGHPGKEEAGIVINPKEEQKIKRIYGLNHSRLERYLRTLIWFSRDSLTSSLEMDANTAARLSWGKERFYVIRTGTDSNVHFDVFPNTYVKSETGEELLFFDFRNQQLRSLTEPDSTASVSLNAFGLPEGFKLVEPGYRADSQLLVLGNASFSLDGHEVGGKRILPKRACEARYEVIRDLKLNADGSKTWQDLPRYELYLCQPLAEALCDWQNWHGFFLLKFPDSIDYNKPAYEVIMSKLPVSARLGILSFVLTYSICIILGIAKAVRDGSPFDAITSMIILIGYSIPGFVLAVFLLKCFGPNDPLVANWIPLGGIHSTGSGYELLDTWGRFWDSVRHLIAPVICLTIGTFAMLTFLMKNSILEHTNRLYAVAARARGLSERRVLFKHILRNSLIPLITGFPTAFLMMFFGGSLLIEKIFNLDGIGLLGFTALTASDFPLLMSNLFVFTLIGLLGRLMTDIAYVMVDPRISFEGGGS